MIELSSIEEISLRLATDWYHASKFRSDVKADLKSYYEGYRDAMVFCQGKDGLERRNIRLRFYGEVISVISVGGPDALSRVQTYFQKMDLRHMKKLKLNVY